MTVKNNHHYRDHAQRITDLEQSITTLIPESIARALCALLKRTSPRIYKDQLVAVRGLLKDHQFVDSELLEGLSQRHELTASMLKRHLEANQQAGQRGRVAHVPRCDAHKHAVLDLSAYALVGHSTGQEVIHESA